MARDIYSDLLAFVAVARERSFTRAAARLGISQSALSHTIRAIETKLGVRLLARSTRSVSTTEAGEWLLQFAAPQFEGIEDDLQAVVEFRDKPIGTIRITATDHAVDTVLWPRLAEVLPRYPEIRVEVVIDYGLTDIVAERFDMGIRLGDEVSKGMTAVRIGPDWRFVIVGTPGYLAKRPIPRNPRELANHQCINLRLPTRGGLYAWELRKGRRQMNARVEGQLVFSGVRQVLDAALAGFGLAYVPEDMARPHLAEGRLRQVLEDWCPSFPGYHLYFPGHRQSSRVMAVLIEALRYRE